MLLTVHPLFLCGKKIDMIISHFLYGTTKVYRTARNYTHYMRALDYWPSLVNYSKIS